jgi:hypothetical protein
MPPISGFPAIHIAAQSAITIMKLLGEKLRGIFAKFSEALPTLLRQGYGGFSSPSSSRQAARYSAKENKI